MDLTKKCCATCADEDCKTGRARGMNGIFLKEFYCSENGFRLWKPQKDVVEGGKNATTDI